MDKVMNEFMKALLQYQRAAMVYEHAWIEHGNMEKVVIHLKDLRKARRKVIKLFKKACGGEE